MLDDVRNSNLYEMSKNIIISKIEDGKFNQWNQKDLTYLLENIDLGLRANRHSLKVIYDLIIDININQTLTNSITGKTIKELLIELQNLNLICYWKKEGLELIFDTANFIHYKDLYL